MHIDVEMLRQLFKMLDKDAVQTSNVTFAVRF